MRDNGDVHFLLSGWGIGWNELSELQAKEQLGNVTLLPPVPQHDLIDFLSAADLWVIPYRRNIAGVSIPSRLYNLLAIGRAIIVAAEENTEAALVIGEEKIGWVVPPEEPAALAEAIARAAKDRADVAEKGRRAATAAAKYSPEVALARYRHVILQAGSRDLRVMNAPADITARHRCCSAAVGRNHSGHHAAAAALRAGAAECALLASRFRPRRARALR